MSTYEKPQYCSLSIPKAFTMLNMSVATIGVETSSETLWTRVFTRVPMFWAFAYIVPRDIKVSFIAPLSTSENGTLSGVDKKAKTPGVVKPTPI